jgi:hypothetical protein
VRRIVLHFHIFKNAGTTVADWLGRSFGERFVPFEETSDRNSYLGAVDLLTFLQRNEQIAAITSHHLRYPLPVAQEFTFFDLCFLRDPIDRLRSIYTFFRNGPLTDDPIAILAHECELGEFLRSLIDQFPHFVNNPHVTLLGMGGAYTRPPGDGDLAKATAVLLNMSFPGVVDLFDESVRAGLYFWRTAFPGLTPDLTPSNVTLGLQGNLQERVRSIEQACGRRVFQQLMDLNALDLELLRRARTEVKRRNQMVPSSL